MSKYTDLLSPQETEEGNKYVGLLSGDVPQETVEQPQIDTSQLPVNPKRKPMSPIVFDEMGKNVRQPGYEPKDIMSSLTGMVTGNQRRQFDIPEFDLPFEASQRQAKTAFGMMSTFDPQREANVLRENYPDLIFSQDDQGNIMVDGSAYGGQVGYMNKPGMSLRDLADVGFTVAGFTPAAKAGAVATTLGKRMATVGAASGATEAGIDLANQAAGGAEDVSVSNIDPGNVALATLGGGVFEGIGVALSKAFAPAWRQTAEITPEIRQTFRESAESVGINADQITDDFIRSYMDRSVGATRGGQGGEFDIRMTQGQQSDDAGQLMLEDRLRSGPSGKARGRMERFSEKQDEDVMAARQRTLEDMGDGQTIDRPAEAGERVVEGIRGKARAAQSATDTAYGEVGQASLSAKGQTGLFTRLKRVAKAEEFETSVELAPATRKAMDQIEFFSDALKEQGGLAKSQPMRRVESFRKKINGWIESAGNNNDRRQLITIKREFDGYLDKAMDRALFSGDPEAMLQLKKARGLHSEYMKKFTPQGGRKRTGGKFTDPAGDAMQRIVESEPTSEEVINMVFGMAKIGGKKNGAKIAERIKKVVGEDSQEWQSMRQAAFLKLTDPGKNRVFSGAKMMTEVTKAQNESPTLFNTLFSKEEQMMFFRFGKEVQKTKPDVLKYGNVSRSGHKMAEYVADSWEKMMLMFGFAQGGPTGAVIAKGGIEAAKEVSGFRAGLKASKAVSQSRPLARMNIGQYGATAAVGTSD